MAQNAKKSREILELLAENSRFSSEEMATMLDLSVSEVEEIIAELEENGTILSYRALINWDQVDKEIVLAFIEVQVTPERDVGFEAIAERIGRYPEVKSLYLMSGGFDLSVLVEGRTMKEVSNFVAKKLAPLDGVRSTTTHFIMQKFKEEGVILKDGEKDRRLVVAP